MKNIKLTKIFLVLMMPLFSGSQNVFAAEKNIAAMMQPVYLVLFSDDECAPGKPSHCASYEVTSVDINAWTISVRNNGADDSSGVRFEIFYAYPGGDPVNDGFAYKVETASPIPSGTVATIDFGATIPSFVPDALLAVKVLQPEKNKKDADVFSEVLTYNGGVGVKTCHPSVYDGSLYELSMNCPAQEVTVTNTAFGGVCGHGFRVHHAPHGESIDSGQTVERLEDFIPAVGSGSGTFNFSFFVNVLVLGLGQYQLSTSTHPGDPDLRFIYSEICPVW